MSYHVKEIFHTLQGEGLHTGRAAVFCRFAGCNLWSGLEKDRGEALCKFCDTDFVGVDGPGGGVFPTPQDLSSAIEQCWLGGSGESTQRFVVLTGGEPALQLDEALVMALKDKGFFTAIETNGTKALPSGIDWVCMSPKAGMELVLKSADEIKLVFPQEGICPEDFVAGDFCHFYLQPKDGPHLEGNTKQAVEYCLKHPQWRLSLQTHKVLGID